MRIERRIPTILGIFVITVSLAATVFLFKNARNFLGRASQDATPAEVKITNISESGFTVSWITVGKVSGTVNFGENSSLGKIATDDRDQVSGKTGEYPTHHATLRYLKPEGKYYFKIISGAGTFDNNGEPYLVTTAKEIGAPSSEARLAYGTVVKVDGTPADGAIVYLNLRENTSVSTLVKSSGNWLLTLSNVRTTDLSDFIKMAGPEEMEIFVQDGSEGTAKAKLRVQDASPAPQITLGKTHDFLSTSQSQTVLPKPTLSPVPTATPSATPTATSASGFKLPPVATSSPTLSTPASGSAVPSDRPVFKGTGIPGAIVKITIKSSAPVTGTTTVDQNGNWSWTPPASLTPQEHTATISTTDSSGKPVQFSRNFTVLASGTQVIESATSSASPKPSPKPSPSPTPTFKPSPTATPSTAPASGNITPTILSLLLGLTFLTLGFGKLFLLDKP